MTPTTPADIEKGKEIVSNFNYATPVLLLDCAKDSEQWAEVVAAALQAERERCCAAVCEWCRDGVSVHRVTDWDGKIVYLHNRVGGMIDCDAAAIRSALAGETK